MIHILDKASESENRISISRPLQKEDLAGRITSDIKTRTVLVERQACWPEAAARAGVDIRVGEDVDVACGAVEGCGRVPCAVGDGSVGGSNAGISWVERRSGATTKGEHSTFSIETNTRTWAE